VFLDSSTTTFYAARRILELGLELTLVTNSLPVMQLVAAKSTSTIELVAVGGALRALTQSFVGPYAVRTVQGHFADLAFFSVKALAASGTLTDADALEAEVKRAMITQARQSILLVDGSKLAARGLSAIAPVSDISIVLAHGIAEVDLRRLRRFSADVRGVATLIGRRQ
jgi:DeoR/GlpR family transcriptional regulator of sugar metabolism